MNAFLPHFPTLKLMVWINSIRNVFFPLLPYRCSWLGILYSNPKPSHVKSWSPTENVGSADEELTSGFVFSISDCRFGVTPTSNNYLVSITIFAGSQKNMCISLSISSKFKKATLKMWFVNTSFFTIES